jgi:hypothetical protein
MQNEEKRFRGTNIKKQLIDAVEQFIREHPEAGYKTIAEFVHDAIRRRIEDVKKIYASSP